MVARQHEATDAAEPYARHAADRVDSSEPADALWAARGPAQRLPGSSAEVTAVLKV
jgi:hypothetical protein